MVLRFMAHVASKEGALVCTRREIAAHWQEHYPYEKIGPMDRLDLTMDASV